MLIEALEAGTITAHAVHARGWIAGEFDPFRLERMELRMDDGPRKRNQFPSGPHGTPGHQALLGALLDGCRDPFAGSVQGTFTELGAWEIDYAILRKPGSIDPPDCAAAHKKDKLPVRVNGRRERMDRGTIRQLSDFATGVRRDFE